MNIYNYDSFIYLYAGFYPQRMRIRDDCIEFCSLLFLIFKDSLSECNEFKLRLKSPQNRFQLSAGLNLENFNTILNETNHIWAVAQI